MLVAQRDDSNLAALLQSVGLTEGASSDQLLPLVYDELRRLANSLLANESPGHTLQATALVNEAYFRLAGGEDRAWQSRRHFFNAAAQTMRRVLVDHARNKKCIKRGGRQEHLPIEDIDMPIMNDFALEDMELVDLVLNRMCDEDPQIYEIVHHRYFNGFTVEQTAEVMQMAPATVKSAWRHGRAWLLSSVPQDRGGADAADE